MDLVILTSFFIYLPFSEVSVFLIDYFTGSKSRININDNFAIVMMPPQPQNCNNLGSRRTQILDLFCRSATEGRRLMPPPPLHPTPPPKKKQKKQNKTKQRPYIFFVKINSAASHFNNSISQE